MTTRGTKIKVGFASSSAPVAPAAPPAATQAPEAPTAGASELNRATTTLSDLCKSSFGRRRGKRKRDEGPKPTAAEAAATKAKNKEAAAQRARASAVQEVPKSGGPQVEIINGKIVVRESSLVVNQGNSSAVDYEEVEEGIHPTATYSSFSKRIYSSPWGIEETRRFYESLRMCGTDFSMLQVFFPGRTRQQLKSKFIREEQQHPELIKSALDSKLPLDLSPFEVHMTGLVATVGGDAKDDATVEDSSTVASDQEADSAEQVSAVAGEASSSADQPEEESSDDDDDLVDV